MSEQEEVEQSSMTVRSNLSSFYKILSSYNSNVLLAALVFLLLVVLFVLLLHFYARFFWSQSDQELRRQRRRRNRRRTVTTTRIIPSIPLGSFDGGVVSASASATATTSDDKGLDSSVISSIPLFVYEEDEKDEEEEEEECVICLGLWEVGDFGRKLRNCGHGFHVECIDMWLSSHSTCPLCRSPVLASSVQENLIKPVFNGVEEEQEDETEIILPQGEVRIEVFGGEESEINDGGSSRSDRRSSASSSLRRMLSSSSSRSRSERNKVFPSATQDSSL
ncbi:hypothetical protein AALP_AA8G376000 [Arabis alpina]|uniref:RING-type E3 ubiquitin transferase n=1 Tax=Arabis alpina TaxID=50452 RepID=A0A087GBY4_ARAAL|nr:hypothetical protein AALP_AA8G376000 [Arabis alpina]